MGMVFLRRLSRWQAETERAAIADLHEAAAPEAPGPGAPGREEFIRAFLDHDVQQPGFDMVLASDPAVIGGAYGFRVDRGSRWWEAYSEVPTEIGGLTRSRQLFAVAGLMVVPAQRRRQVGTRLLRELLNRTDASLAIAVLRPGDAAAQAAFESWGWSKAGQLTPVDGAGPLQAWARHLGATA